ncbi:putative bifunctional diguanylate cyclase/phosphodiesterase [endosymbiont of Riftia pachyptila]|uniref:Putative signaling protein n=1 Tax=endosymbiont of Riftia pachyptila (vent Ph05) TaxID=1048808 RepID=G2DHX4_9GAMM|nr:GGDEF domain-containing phosphodiesterase [endosymbiont of Riftia pachyptila]EGV49781.1 putative signaling protein [endosymbiont of Riftia pachyptila (vent Ph05)]
MQGLELSLYDLDTNQRISLLANSQPLMGNDGHLEAVVVTYHDITANKRAESELRLAASAFEVPESMFITNHSGIIQHVNQEFSTMTGYKPDELVGSDSEILASEHHSNDFYVEMMKTLESAGRWEGELWCKRKDQKQQPLWAKITSIQTEKDKESYYLVSMVDLNTQYRKQNEMIARAYHDETTGLPNRTLLLDRLDQSLARSARSGVLGAVLSVEIDHFVNVNQTLGHLIADRLLKELAERLKRNVRRDDTLARSGDGQFTLILNEVASNQDIATQSAIAIAEKFKARISRPFHIFDHEVHVTSSIAISTFDGKNITTESVINQLDTTRKAAKEEGINSIRCFHPEMLSKVKRQLSIENDMRIALQRDQFSLFFQPKINVKNGQLSGAEALIRWKHPQQGYIDPSYFIPIAEENGLIEQLGEFVLREVCCRISIWQQSGLRVIPISINISAVQIRHDKFINSVNSILKETGVNPRYLEFEITESALEQNFLQIKRTIHSLKDQGIIISIDDFGTGYSNLSYLNEIVIDRLKIDQSFIYKLTEQKCKSPVAETIISLAHNFGMTTVGEGVETKAQFDFLRELGCDEAQGYFFCKPVSINIFSDLLKNPQVNRAS